ncbi:MAG TPA: glycosyl hydrolase family 28 protein [Opitutus sp.]|nr:glycosyl hydrolase family 28 protein [Opitutus sp.]
MKRHFDVTQYGAIGDGITLDTAAIQRAIDEAANAGSGAQVLVRGGKRYLIGALQLKARIDFHLADDAELIVSTDPAHFAGGAALQAVDAHGLKITGTGSINGRSREFMTYYDEVDEWWRPKPFRPRLMVLTGCKDLEIRDVTFRDAPSWTLHLVGCERVLIDGVKIRNQLDVPNCDRIDPDHCRDVEIKNCDIECGDDAIVIKATRQGARYGGCSNIVVSDCVLATQDSGVKIGTETVADIRGIRFERCRIKTSCRGCTIQLRDEGNISDVEFRDIEFVARYHSAPWWGRGEAISFTAIPRTPDTRLGQLSNVRVINVTGRAENSVRINGSPQSRIQNVVFDHVALTLERWTKYPGAVWDNRPTTAMPDLEPHNTPGFGVRSVDHLTLKATRLTWGAHRPDYFTHALEAEDVTGLKVETFSGEAAHPARDQAIVVR